MYHSTPKNKYNSKSDLIHFLSKTVSQQVIQAQIWNMQKEECEERQIK